MDGYFIPAADLAGEFIRAGLPVEKLIPSGIPVRQAFYSAITRQEARIGLGLPEQGQVLLMMCGSMGCGPMKVLAESLVNRLDDDTTVVALEGDTLLLNLSGRFAALIRTEGASYEQLLCYSIVNTLCEAKGLKRVLFFFDGEAAETLGGTLYWGGEFLLCPGLIDRTKG